MKRTILRLSDFEDQAAAILAASKARRADARMETIENDEGDPPGSEDEDDDEDDPDDDDADDDADKKDKGADKKDDKDSDKSDGDKVDRAEYDRVKRHRAAADRRVADLTAENTTLKNQLAAAGKDGKDGEGSSERVTELQGQVDSAKSTIQDLRIQNAFLSANQYTWHDAGDALRLADLRDVEIEEDGTVVGLKEALQKLAKDKPHLIKKAESNKKDDKDDADEKNPSGSANNGRRKGGTKKPDRAALSKTYPVLASRR